MKGNMKCTGKYNSRLRHPLWGKVVSLLVIMSIITIGAFTNVEANGTEQNLSDYIARLNNVSGQDANIEFHLYTTNNTELSEDENGNITVTDSSEYRIGLDVYSSAGFDPGTYIYDMPEGVTLGAANGNITVGGVTIGTWNVVTGEEGNSSFRITINESDEATYTDVTIQLSAKAGFTRQTTDIVIGDQTIVVNESSNLFLSKSASFEKEHEGYYTSAKWEIEFSQSGTPLAGTLIEDIASDTEHNRLFDSYWGQNEYSRYTYQHFDTTTPLQFTLTKPDGTVYHWNREWSDSNLVLYTAPAVRGAQVTTTTNVNDRIVGYSYSFPDTLQVYDENNEAVSLNLLESDEWGSYQINITSRTNLDFLPSVTALSVYYYNTALATNTKQEKKIAQASPHQDFQIDGNYRVNKIWERGDDAVSVNWTVDSYIAGNMVTSYQLRDYMRIRKTVDGKTSMDPVSSDIYDHNTNLTISIPEDAAINEMSIPKGTYTMYDINSDKAVPDSAQFVYYFYYDKSSSIGFYVFGMECHCTEEHCANWQNDTCNNVIYTNPNTQKKYCTCWQLDQKSKVQLNYTTTKTDMLALLSEHGTQDDIYLYNNAQLDAGVYKNRKVYLYDTSKLDTEDSYVGMALAQKALLTPASAENDYTASYQIEINKAHVQLTENGAPITITDTMSDTMTFLGDLIIHSTDTDNNTTTLVYGSDYTYEYDSDTHTLTIQIEDPETNSYKLNYSTQMLNPVSQAKYSNSFVLSWQGKDVRVTTKESSVTDVSSSGATYRITIKKEDELSKILLSGAEFSLNSADGKVMKKGTTDTKGQLVFRTVAGSGQDALILNHHTLYYLQETEAPEGYTLDETKYYFYFCNEKGECTRCRSLRAALPEGVDPEDVHRHENGAFVTITNRQKTHDVTIRKIDASANADGSFDSLTGAEFYLYYENAVLDSDGNPTSVMHRYYAVLDDNGTLTGWNSNISKATKLSVDASGRVKILGLSAGDYYLEEVVAPDGYRKLSEPIGIHMSNTNGLSENSKEAEITTEGGTTILNVKNTSVFEFPQTGGDGISRYISAGLFLILLSAFYIYRRRILS